jgi:hypothetical protein
LPAQCEFCHRKFDSEEELTKHIRVSHADRVKLDKLEHPLKRSDIAGRE